MEIKEIETGVAFAKQSVRIAIAFVGAIIGPALVALTDSILRAIEKTVIINPVVLFIFYVISAIGFGILFYFLAPSIIKRFRNFIGLFERSLSDIPINEMVVGVVGLIIGLVLSFLLSTLLLKIPLPGINIAITVMTYVVLGVLGWTIGQKRSKEFKMVEGLKKNREGNDKTRNEAKKNKDVARPKILDTSVIIDGRIFDICKTGIIEGELVIPGFVLQELRHISDSSDGLKRNRGRRGLDILNKIQKELDVPVRIEEKDYDDIAEVDAKLLKLTQELSGVVVTNDYNLNKVAAVQDILVLNINELANAVKPVVLPGEEMKLVIMKIGKEMGQGIAYLDDGTMIVVDGGKKFLGEPIDVIVTSVLQTSAGRMIFGKLK